MKIEKAKPEQLHDICELVQNSITKLCAADHFNQQHHIEAWVADRSIENIEQMLFTLNSITFVCVDNTHIVGVSHLTNSGVLDLCYVQYQHIGKGIGRMILAAAETQAQAWACDEISLISSATAKQFYLSHGYEQHKETIIHIGMPGYPLRKRLRQ